MADTSLLLTPFVQYGFAGLCAAQLVFIGWLVTRMLKAFENNTKAYQRLISMLATRPCLYNDRVFQGENEG